MKKFTPQLFLFCLIFPITIFSQNFVDAEVDVLAEKIASKVDTRNESMKKKKRYNSILVEDFTDTEGKISKLGASLAEEFSLALSNAAVSFTVTGIHDLAQSPERKNKVNLNGLLQGAGKILDGTTDDTNYEQNQKNRDATKTVDGVVEIGASFQQNRRNYKGIDAVVTGTLTESNDQYRLLIKVISTRSGNGMIATGRGFITKTPFILKLEEKENKRLQTAPDNIVFGTKGGSASSRNNIAQQEFTSNNTKVELLDAKQVGQNIECYFRITNTGPDLEFYLYGSNSGGKLIDSNNSYDYWASQVKLGEVVDNKRVQKTLVTNNPVEAKITFGGVARDVHKVAKLNVKCHGHGGIFWIEFRDVEVN